MRNIGIIGKARSGKDSAAAHLVAEYAYTRLAFADPLKEMALKVDPWIVQEGDHASDDYKQRLSELVSERGWEWAKDNYPEVRRFLQQLGQTQRDFDEDYWLNILLRKAAAAKPWRMPVVVTDVRYRNEALALRARGFKLIRLTRSILSVPLVGSGTIPARRLSDAPAAHASETDLDTFAADQDILNNGSIETLRAMIAAAIV